MKSVFFFLTFLFETWLSCTQVVGGDLEQLILPPNRIISIYHHSWCICMYVYIYKTLQIKPRASHMLKKNVINCMMPSPSVHPQNLKYDDSECQDVQTQTILRSEHVHIFEAL